MVVKQLQFLLISLMCLIICECKVYSKCEFARTIRNEGITDRGQLGTWTCIANYESHFNTKAINRNSGDYGILQISHLYWCSDSNQPGKGCNITCKSLLADEINTDITCAKKIFAEHQRLFGDGFSAWVAYQNYCRGDQTNWISGCDI
ncbi:hypothetical protein ABEB36_010197 [Hypothenemus hampei]|uniref:lysozyme n=1 Tax=Hypothenemus hampei TaxID=57062 RepID=A0ABD1EMZ0_HYPHA